MPPSESNLDAKVNGSGLRGENVRIDPSDMDNVESTNVQGALLELDSAVGSGVSALNDITDVDVGSPADGDVLTYDDATSTWISAAGGGGGGGGDLAATLILGNITDGTDIVLSDGDAIRSSDAEVGSGFEGGALNLSSAEAVGDQEEATAQLTIEILNAPLTFSGARFEFWRTGRQTFNNRVEFFYHELRNAGGPRTSGNNDFDGTIADPELLAAEIAEAINDPNNSFVDGFGLDKKIPKRQPNLLFGFQAEAVGSTITLTATSPGKIGNTLRVERVSISADDLVFATENVVPGTGFSIGREAAFIGGRDGGVKASGALQVSSSSYLGSITIGAVTLTAIAGPRTPGLNDFNGNAGVEAGGTIANQRAALRTEIMAALNDPDNDFAGFLTAIEGTGTGTNFPWITLIANEPGFEANDIVITPAFTSGFMNLDQFSGGFLAPGNVVLDAGNGALISSGSQADRGVRSVDLQRSATNSMYSSYGDYSTISGGRNNLAWGRYSTVVGGARNFAYADLSIVGGKACKSYSDYSTSLGYYNYIYLTNTSSLVTGSFNYLLYGSETSFGNVLMGSQSTLQGGATRAFVNYSSIRGYASTAFGTNLYSYGRFSFVAGSFHSAHRINPPQPIMSGGLWPNASWRSYGVGTDSDRGRGSVTMGYDNSNVARFTYAGGAESLTHVAGQFARGIGRSAPSFEMHTPGSNQWGVYGLKGVTIDDAGLTLTCGPTDEKLLLRQNQAIGFRARITAHEIGSVLLLTARPAAGSTITIGGNVLTATTSTSPGIDQFRVSTTATLASHLNWIVDAINRVGSATEPLVYAQRQDGASATYLVIGSKSTSPITLETDSPNIQIADNVHINECAFWEITGLVVRGRYTQARGTYSVTGTVSPGDEFTIGTVTLTAVDTSPAGVGEFLIGATPTATAGNIYTAVRSSNNGIRDVFIDREQPGGAGFSSGDTRDLIAHPLGTEGNGIIISTTSAEITTSGTFSGGVDSVLNLVAGGGAPVAPTHHTPEAAGWTVEIVENNDDQTLDVRVVGSENKAILWTAALFTSEASFRPNSR